MFSPYGTEIPSNNTVWHPEPTFRGTYNILSTCLITLGLCVWTALHLNIPENGKASKQFLRKASWLLIGLFAPELIAWTAYEQYRTAREIHQFMRKALEQSPPLTFRQKMTQELRKRFGRAIPSNGHEPVADVELKSESRQSESRQTAKKRRHSWTMVHSYYAAMGGFAIDSGDAEVNFLPVRYPRMALNRRGLEYVVENYIDLLPDLSESQIKDKSKGSSLAKAVVCFQATWFCIQCIFRLAQGLSISLLELNVFGHALCALLIYLLWWNKPLDVEEPTLLRGPYQNEVFALMIWKSGYDSLTFVAARPKANCNNMDCSTLSITGVFDPYPISWGLDALREEFFQSGYVQDIFREAVEEHGQPPLKPNHTRLYCGQILHGFCLREPYRDIDYCIRPENADKHGLWKRNFYSHVDLTEGEVQLLKLLNSARGRGLAIPYYALHPVATNWPSLEAFNSKKPLNPFWRLLFGFTLAGLIYGGLHLTAWNAPFATRAERILWKISAVTLTGSGLIFLLIFLPDLLLPTSPNYREEIPPVRTGMQGFISTAFDGLYLLVVGLCIAQYCFARVNLVVECFLSLAHLPDSVFIVPTWSQFVPHII